MKHHSYLTLAEIAADAPPVPAGMARRWGVEVGCGNADCKDCYEARQTRERIIKLAARDARRDYQEAENDAYEVAIRHGYSETEAAEMALEAGIECKL